jgi:hypothetical protein
MKTLTMGCVLLAVAACVRPEDTEAWVGQPVAALQTHPVFVTMPLVRTRAADGSEIWNFVNGTSVTTCERSVGSNRGSVLNSASYSSFTSCMSGTMACNNIFLVRNGVVQRYTPIGTGGAFCYTDARLQPGFAGSTNIK